LGVEGEDVALVAIQPMTGLLYPAVDFLSDQVSKHLNRGKVRTMTEHQRRL